MESAHQPRRAGLARPSLGHVILLAAVAGIVTGLVFPSMGLASGWLSELFLRMVRLLIAPLLVGVLVPAIANAGAARTLGRLGWRSLVVFEVATTAALLVGWTLTAFTRIGVGVGLPMSVVPVVAPTTFRDVVLTAVPTSIVDALARGDVLQIVVFCLIFGAGALAVGPRARPVVEMAESLAAVAFRCTAYVMWVAPLAVWAALASTVATHGTRLLQGLGLFVGLTWLASGVFLAGLALVLLACRVPLVPFVRHLRTPFIVGLATSSSAAALPQTLVALERFGVAPRVRDFVTPLSLTLHMNGAALYLGLATLFVAQAAGTPLPWSTQLMMLLTLKVVSKGSTGIPRATVVLLAAVSDRFGLPPSGVALLLGVDALVDPIRTAVNVTSHFAAPVLVQRWEARGAAPAGDRAGVHAS